jgi:hypothetical protein
MMATIMLWGRKLLHCLYKILTYHYAVSLNFLEEIFSSFARKISLKVHSSYMLLTTLCLCLQELTSFMEYVDKLATSAAETAFLGGAEHMSTVMCESLNSAHAKVKRFYVS